MKYTHILATVLLGLAGIFTAGSVQAAEIDLAKMTPEQRERAIKEHMKKVAREVEKKEKAERYKTVAAAIENLEFFNGTPDTKAKYYIYLHSASWCGPCKALMPQIMEQYEDMQKAKVEIILIGCDSTVEAATQYISHYNENIAGILSKDPGAKKLPGFSKADGIPHATIVDRKGKVLYNGHGIGAVNWKNYCGKKKNAKKKNAKKK